MISCLHLDLLAYVTMYVFEERSVSVADNNYQSLNMASKVLPVFMRKVIPGFCLWNLHVHMTDTMATFLFPIAANDFQQL